MWEILEIRTLVKVCAAEVLVHIIYLVGLFASTLGGLVICLHLVHEDLLFLLHSSYPLHVDLYWVEIHSAASSAFFCLHYIF